MKKLIVAGCVSMVLMCAAGFEARAQGGAATKGPDPAVVADAELEKEAKHGLEVAKHYFKLKKAYRASLTRSEEIVAGYPNFSRLDYALYIAGMSNLYLAEGKGKQKSTEPADKLRGEARTYLSRLAAEFPDSEFRREAEDQLRKLSPAVKPAGDRP
jgi:outer membrane protein assembly factor BamD (BamD/ComL family)